MTDLHNLTNTELALTITREQAVTDLLSITRAPALSNCQKVFGWRTFLEKQFAANEPIKRLYYGSEFCERLIPDKQSLSRVMTEVQQTDLDFTLMTPLVSDKGLRRLMRILTELPDASEVVVNDWGVMRLLCRDFPSLVPVVGRQLYKMIKDPRLPSAQWTKLYPHDIQSGPFQHLLEKFGVSRLEMDVPPFANRDDFQSQGRALSVHLPFGYSVKGRMCKIGAVNLDSERKFGPGHGCQKECLKYSGKTTRDPSQGEQDLDTFQQGNTLFYRHSSEMLATVLEAAAQRRINRLVFTGDWHENYRTH